MYPKGQVHVLEIGSEALRKSTDAAQQIAPIEGAGCTRTEDPAATQVTRSDRLTVAALARYAAAEIAVAGAVDGAAIAR